MSKPYEPTCLGLFEEDYATCKKCSSISKCKEIRYRGSASSKAEE